jgi:hypothetical protein
VRQPIDQDASAPSWQWRDIAKNRARCLTRPSGTTAAPSHGAVAARPEADWALGTSWPHDPQHRATFPGTLDRASAAPITWPPVPGVSLLPVSLPPGSTR